MLYVCTFVSVLFKQHTHGVMCNSKLFQADYMFVLAVRRTNIPSPCGTTENLNVEANSRSSYAHAVLTEPQGKATSRCIFWGSTTVLVSLGLIDIWSQSVLTQQFPCNSFGITLSSLNVVVDFIIYIFHIFFPVIFFL